MLVAVSTNVAIIAGFVASSIVSVVLLAAYHSKPSDGIWRIAYGIGIIVRPSHLPAPTPQLAPLTAAPAVDLRLPHAHGRLEPVPQTRGQGPQVPIQACAYPLLEAAVGVSHHSVRRIALVWAALISPGAASCGSCTTPWCTRSTSLRRRLCPASGRTRRSCSRTGGPRSSTRLPSPVRSLAVSHPSTFRSNAADHRSAHRPPGPAQDVHARPVRRRHPRLRHRRYVIILPTLFRRI